MMTCRKFDLEDRLIDFTIMIDKIIEQLPVTKLGNHLSGQADSNISEKHRYC